METLSKLEFDLLHAGIIILSLFVTPVLYRRLVEPRLLKTLAKRQSTNGRIVVRQVSKVLWFWTLLLGIYLLQLRFDSLLPRSIAGSISLILRVFAVLGLVWFVNKVIQESLQYYSRKGKLPSTTIFSNLTRIGIFALAVTSVMYSMGLSIAPLLATIGVGGLAIALALQDTLSSLFAGIYIIMSKQLNPGDYIRISATEEGFIQDINWRNTTIRTRENNIIIVPNRSLSNLTITNFSLLSKEMSLVIPVGVHYDADLEMVESLTIAVGKEILAEVPGGVVDFVPLIRYNAFADSAITFNVILRIQEYTSQGQIRHQFIKKLRKRFAENGITIPYPMRTLTFEQPLETRPLLVEQQ